MFLLKHEARAKPGIQVFKGPRLSVRTCRNIRDAGDGDGVDGDLWGPFQLWLSPILFHYTEFEL